MMPYRPGDPAHWPAPPPPDSEPPDTARDIPPPEPSHRGGHVLPRGSDDYRCDDPLCRRCAR